MVFLWLFYKVRCPVPSWDIKIRNFPLCFTSIERSLFYSKDDTVIHVYSSVERLQIGSCLTFEKWNKTVSIVCNDNNKFDNCLFLCCECPLVPWMCSTFQPAYRVRNLGARCKGCAMHGSTNRELFSASLFHCKLNSPERHACFYPTQFTLNVDEQCFLAYE